MATTLTGVLTATLPFTYSSWMNPYFMYNWAYFSSLFSFQLLYAILILNTVLHCPAWIGLLSFPFITNFNFYPYFSQSHLPQKRQHPHFQDQFFHLILSALIFFGALFYPSNLPKIASFFFNHLFKAPLLHNKPSKTSAAYNSNHLFTHKSTIWAEQGSSVVQVTSSSPPWFLRSCLVPQLGCLKLLGASWLDISHSMGHFHVDSLGFPHSRMVSGSELLYGVWLLQSIKADTVGSS